MNIIYNKSGELRLILTYLDALKFMQNTTILSDNEIKKIINSCELIQFKYKLGVSLPCKMVEA